MKSMIVIIYPGQMELQVHTGRVCTKGMYSGMVYWYIYSSKAIWKPNNVSIIKIKYILNI